MARRAAAYSADDARGRAWDQEDSYGVPAVYRALEPKDKNNDRVSLVIGPWRHSGLITMATTSARSLSRATRRSNGA